MNKTHFTLALALSGVLLFAIQARLAQGKTGQLLSIKVQVTDSQGVVIPSAAVWLRGRPGTAVRVSITDDEGACVFSELANGLSIQQGVSMGRRSEIEAEARKSDGVVTSVSVCGATAHIASGEIEVPPSALVS